LAWLKSISGCWAWKFFRICRRARNRERSRDELSPRSPSPFRCSGQQSTHLLLLLLVTRGQTHLLLSIVKHHLLHHCPCVTIQIAQLRVLWRELRRVDLGVLCEDVGPPFGCVGLFQVDRDKAGVLCSSWTGYIGGQCCSSRGLFRSSTYPATRHCPRA
jgi:hypothetical protein